MVIRNEYLYNQEVHFSFLQLYQSNIQFKQPFFFFEFALRDILIWNFVG